jgi:hypothetical protein
MISSPALSSPLRNEGLPGIVSVTTHPLSISPTVQELTPPRPAVLMASAAMPDCGDIAARHARKFAISSWSWGTQRSGRSAQIKQCPSVRQSGQSPLTAEEKQVASVKLPCKSGSAGLVSAAARVAAFV